MSIYSKLLEVQKTVGTVTKDSSNPFFNSQYFDINKLLETVKPVLTANGLVLLQPLTEVNGAPAITTTIADAETGETVSSTTVIPPNADPQKAGSGITYFRRYALASLLGMQAQDDDGAVASGTTVNRKPKAAVKKAAASKF